jgi:hypothetical protein
METGDRELGAKGHSFFVNFGVKCVKSSTCKGVVSEKWLVARVFEVSGQEHAGTLVWSFGRGVEAGVCSVGRWFELVIAMTCEGVSEKWPRVRKCEWLVESEETVETVGEVL